MIKNIYKALKGIVMVALGFFAAWFIWRREDKGLSAEEYINEKAEKAKEQKHEEILNTPAADVGSGYLSTGSNAAIDNVKQSAKDKLLRRRGQAD